MKGIELEKLTWNDAESVLKKAPVVVIPLGACLQEHALHLPLNTDFLVAERLKRFVLKNFGIVSLPTVQHSYFPAFVDYPGSVSIPEHTAKEFLKSIILSLAPYCHKKFYVLNTGQSTCWILEPLKWQLHDKGIILEYFDWRDLEGIEEILDQPEGSHADELETSLLLHLAPELVLLQNAKKDIHPKKGPGPFTREQGDPRGRYSPTGGHGDPLLANKEKGSQIWQIVKSHVGKELTELSRADYELKPEKENYL